MTETLWIDKLNRLYPMIGLSADWIYQTWLISGNVTKGTVIFNNEDDDSYELISFHYDEDENLVANMEYSGSLEYVAKTALSHH
ncbi:hypothetical protein [Aeromonas jandaei]|uniref:hypothetical protein n=1 Tax=Aeromonas jandaei TaxID=650 RepID=UPI0019200BC5|nr:hypothetical protein [Aeromonas jandaei]MBL0625786.1 hypothetical protein [Aeromonas jandaei]